ncbi:hypothetical protein HPB50_013937 [Hyalomma asiaticum]|uniref:Uncharacterized protein n=1 Tax=Hyalomma asiaticum TaxID=266040 RepID=A0ACB7T6U4_HYAAI|nr:hypothetical protein HPB50_013937 [Hyalomma asiaticum]
MSEGSCRLTVTCLSGGTNPSSALLRRLFDLPTTVRKADVLGSIDNGICYEDPITNYHVDFTPSKSYDYALEVILNHWKDPKEMKLLCNSVPGWWLSWPRLVDSTINEHYDLKLSSFSLGSFVGMGMFVEHYCSSPREPKDPAKGNSKPANQRPASSSNKKQQYRITQCMAHFAHYRQRLYIYFVDVKEPLTKQEQNGETHARHRFIIKYSSVRHVVVSKNPDGGDSDWVVYLHLVHPPLLYRVHETHCPDDKYSDGECDQRKPRYVEQHSIDERTRWVRVVDFGKQKTKCGSGTLAFCRVMALTFSSAGDRVEEALACLGTLSTTTNLYYGAVELKVRQCKGIAEAEKELHVEDLPFGCGFALAAVWRSSAQVADELLISGAKKQVAEALRRMASEDPEALQEALYSLQQSLDSGRFVSFKMGLEGMYKLFHSMRQRSGMLTGGVLGQELPEHVCLVRRAVLTPTRLLPLPPQPISTSRILHHFEPEHALRLLIRDEDGTKMSFSLGIQRGHFLFAYTRPRLLEGFTIAGRKFVFLASSTSQLRSHGAWFYSVDSKGRSADDVRSALGDLSHLHLPSKYMARLGLAFSQSLGRIHVPRECTEVVPDIECKGRRKNLHYVFSDGVGRISTALMAKVHKALPDEGQPSAIQIRYGGCKGMLVEDPTLEGERIVFRKSMYKHPSESEDLFILKTSRPRSVKLNRPMITILSQKETRSNLRSIEDSVFLEMQQDCLAPYMDSLFDDAAAARLLHEECALRLPYKELASAGLDLHAEPFFRSLLWTLHQRCLQQLREKASIAVPPEYGRTMFGVMDETGTLRYGEVFVQYSRDFAHYKPDDEYVILKGSVVVTKNPCVHAGDIRKLEAVDVPALHHIRDCIVFPSGGERPHPNEMAGSDLDGDEYSVIWYPPLIFHKNDKPMDFYDDEAPENEGPIQHDIVGIISNAHLAWADWLRQGVKSNMCTTLARKVSRAVDFAKRGRPETLLLSEKPAAYPDFMQKHCEKDTYLSRNVLGKLYRKLGGMVLDSVGPVADVKPDSRLIVEGHEEHMEVAREALARYRLRIRSLLATYGIASEVEALSGAVMTMDPRISEKHDHTDVAVVVECQVKHIMARTRGEFLGGICVDYKDAKRRASAWYRCAYEQGAQAEGFAWCVADELVDILRCAAPTDRPTRGSIRDRVTHALIPRSDQAEIPFETALLNNALKLLVRWLKGNKESLWNTDETAAVAYVRHVKLVLQKTLTQLEENFGVQRIRKQPSLVLVNVLKNLMLRIQPKSGKHKFALADLAERTLFRLLYPGKVGDDLPLESVTPVGPKQTQVVLLPMRADDDFFLAIERQEKLFRELLQHWMQLEKVKIMIWQDARDDWFFKLMVTGSPWALDRLKQTIIHEGFHEELKRILSEQGTNQTEKDHDERKEF